MTENKSILGTIFILRTGKYSCRSNDGLHFTFQNFSGLTIKNVFARTDEDMSCGINVQWKKIQL